MKNKTLFYSTGIKILVSFYDVIKFKLRIADYDDVKGIRYTYLISIKIFGWEFYRIKYKNQKGKVYKRVINIGG